MMMGRGEFFVNRLAVAEEAVCAPCIIGLAGEGLTLREAERSEESSKGKKR